MNLLYIGLRINTTSSIDAVSGIRTHISLCASYSEGAAIAEMLKNLENILRSFLICSIL
jgi:hypothetical protein